MMMKRLFMRLSVSFAGVACSLFASFGATYHVETTGDDTQNDGSAALPFATIAKALTVATSEGDRVEVGPGTYVLSSALTISNPVTVIGTAGPTKTTIDCNNKVKVTVDNAGATLAGVTVTRGNANWNKGGNVYMTANGGVVSNCHLVACRNYEATYGGGLCAEGGLVTHCLIARNKFSNQRAAGAYISNAILRNSIICCNTNTSSQWQAGGVWASGSSVVENCTIFGNVAVKSCGLYLDSKAVKVRNTIIWGNTLTGGAASDYSGDASCVTYSCFPTAAAGGTNISTDPGLDADGRIALGSPCIDAGDTTLAWLAGAKDIDGNPRVYGTAVDIGASEFVPDRTGVVTITGSPSEAGVVSPAYGEHDGWTEGQRATFTAPETVSSETERATCIGYRIFDVDAKAGTETEIAGSPFTGHTFEYVHGTGERRVVWLFGDNESRISVTADGGTVDVPNDGWCTTGEPVTLTAVPTGERSFWCWEGTGASESDARRATVTFTVTGPMAITAKFSNRHILDPGDSIADAIAAAEAGDTILLSEGNYPQSATLLVDKEVFVESETGRAEDACITRNSSKSEFSLVTLNHAYACLRHVTITGGYWNKNYANPANLTITGAGGTAEDCRILNASVKGYGSSGSAVLLDSDAGVLRRCLVKGNTAEGSGGGAGLLLKKGLAVDCLFTGNENTDGSAKGIVSVSGGKLLNCTITGNKSRNVAGVTATAGLVRNCLISGNTQTGVPDEQTAVYSGDASLFGNCLASILINAGCFVGTPVFADAESDDVRLCCGSAGIDAGADDAALDSTDLYGDNRVQGPAVDIGCAEYDPTVAAVALSVTKTSGAYPFETTYTACVANVTGWKTCGWDFDGDGTIDETTETLSVVHTVTSYLSGAVPTVTLYDANGAELAVSENVVRMTSYPSVIYVNGQSTGEKAPYDTPQTAAKTIASAVAIAGDGTTIRVAKGNYATSEMTLGKAIAICGETGDSADVVITRPGAKVVRAFTLNNPSALIAGVTISGFAGTDNYSYGHAVYIDSNGGTVSNCMLHTCKSDNWGAVGGAVYMAGSGLVTHCVISNCSASTYGNGGSAVYMTAGTVRNTLMTGNSYPSTESSTTQWGSLYMKGGTVENCTLAGNSSRSCAGIWCESGTVRNCVIAGNTSAREGEAYKAWAGTADSFFRCVTDTTAINDTCANDDSPFVAAAVGNYHLVTSGTAVDFAEELDWMAGGKDLDGNDRIRGDAPDAGCYEAEVGVFSASVKALGETEGYAPLAVTIQATPVFGSDQGYTLKWYDGAASEPFLVTNELTFVYRADTPGRHELTLTIVDDGTGTPFTTESPLVVYAAPETLYVAAKDETVESAYPYATPETAAPDLASAYAAALEGATIVMKRGVHEATAQLVLNRRVTVTGETDDPEETRFYYRGSESRLFYCDKAGVVIRNLAMDAKYHGNGNLPTVAHLLYANASCVVSNCVFRNAKTRWGGYGSAVYLEDGVLSHCVITNNLLDANCISTEGTSKKDGKGIAVHMRDGRIENCLVAYNADSDGSQTNYNGGAIYLANGLVVNCTVVSNRFPGCAGVYADGGRVANTVIARNVSTVAGGEASVWRGDVAFCDHCASDTLAVDGRIVCGDLKFRNAEKGDWRIRARSVAKDIGDDTARTEATDLSGRPRRVGQIDIGCYENQSGGLMLLVK